MPDYVTKADLLESADRVLEKDQKLRHELGKKVHQDYTDISEKVGNNDKELALLKQSHNTMNDNHGEIKKDIKIIREEVQTGLKEIKDIIEVTIVTFATKEDYENNKTEIKDIKSEHKKILIAVITGLIGIILLILEKIHII